MSSLSPEQARQSETERRRRLVAMAEPAPRDGPGAELVLAADQFVITPAGRIEDAARAHAAGDEVRTVIAGYHWFTDWGRDTMISLEGLTLVTGRHEEAGLHPAHLRPLRARRPDPEHVPGGRQRGALPHRRRDALVLPRASPLSRALHRTTGDACADCCRCCTTSSRTTSRARNSASASTRRTAC